MWYDKVQIKFVLIWDNYQNEIISFPRYIITLQNKKQVTVNQYTHLSVSVAGNRAN